MMPHLFESIVFLLENKEWWDVHFVQEVVAGLWNDRLQVHDYSEAGTDIEDSEW